MTSDEIRRAVLMETAALKEIAFQLAIANERESDSRPHFVARPRRTPGTLTFKEWYASMGGQDIRPSDAWAARQAEVDAANARADKAEAHSRTRSVARVFCVRSMSNGTVEVLNKNNATLATFYGGDAWANAEAFADIDRRD